MLLQQLSRPILASIRIYLIANQNLSMIVNGLPCTNGNLVNVKDEVHPLQNVLPTFFEELPQKNQFLDWI